VLPVSIDDAHVCAELENGEIIKGETNIDKPKHNGEVRIKKIYLEPNATMYEEAYTAIKHADLIVFGPGDLYTSIIPNVLVKGFAEAMKESHAQIAYVVNVMTKWGETNGFTASHFVSELLQYLKKDSLDYVICNNATIPLSVQEKYKLEKAFPVVVDKDVLQKKASRIVMEDLLHASDIVRHDSKKLAHVLLSILG
jgi:uncharacterized cofD-like protein